MYPFELEIVKVSPFTSPVAVYVGFTGDLLGE